MRDPYPDLPDGWRGLAGWFRDVLTVLAMLGLAMLVMLVAATATRFVIGLAR